MEPSNEMHNEKQDEGGKVLSSSPDITSPFLKMILVCTGEGVKDNKRRQ